MEVMVLGPAAAEGQQALGQKAAQVYADAVLARLDALSCPGQQKLALLEAVKKAVP